MTVEANRTPPIHQRKLEIGRRPRRSPVPAVPESSVLGRRHFQMRSIRRRKLLSSFRSMCNTPLLLLAARTVPAETPGNTGFAADETFKPPKLSS